MNLKRFKIGDVVFVSNKMFDKPIYSVKTGHIMKVVKLEKELCLLDDGKSTKPTHYWPKKYLIKDLTIYNKKNWCRVFLGMMNDPR